MIIRDSLSFDDVLLVPQYSEIVTRHDIDLSNNMGEIILNVPIISSPMDTVTEYKMASIIDEKFGGLGIIHRYMSIDNQVNQIKLAIKNSNKEVNKNIGFAIGATKDYIERLDECINAGGNIVCIDVAHGHHILMKDALYNIKKRHPNIHIIAGNVATSKGFLDLSNWGADTIRCGIGSGCFVGNTMITTDSGYKKIKDVDIGDLVLTHTGNYKRVYNTFIFDKKPYCVQLNNDTIVTENHEYFVINQKYKDIVNKNNYLDFAEWISAGKLTKDYFLIELIKNDDINIKLSHIYNIRFIENYDFKYDLSVEDDHSYVANGVIVHNSICSTRLEVGHGIPVLQTIVDCYNIKKEHKIDTKIICDGGIKVSGDIVKAIAAGADFCMMGSMFAGTSESPGDVIIDKRTGEKFKTYRGMASKEAQMAWKESYSSNEGISTQIRYKGSVINHLDDIIFNVKSGFSYSGAKNINELRNVAQWVFQTFSGQIESSTHILNR